MTCYGLLTQNSNALCCVSLIRSTVMLIAHSFADKRGPRASRLYNAANHFCEADLASCDQWSFRNAEDSGG